MSKAQLQAEVNYMVSLNKWTSKTINFTPTGQECWAFSSIKESVKYFPVFNAAGNVEQCLLVPLNDKSFEKIKVGNDLVLKKAGDSAWITPPNVNGIVCGFKIIKLRETPVEYGFMVGGIQ